MTRTNGDFWALPRRCGDRADQLHRAVGGEHADVEQAVVGLRVGEDLDAAEQFAHVSDQDAAGGPLYQRVPSTLIFASKPAR